MAEEKLFGVEEARGLLDVVQKYLRIEGDLPSAERRGLGRLLGEIVVSIEAAEEPAPPQGGNVHPWPRRR